MTLTDLLDDDRGIIDVAMWDTRCDFENGNGARSFVSDGNLELVDQPLGWEYLVCAPDDAFICFNADEVFSITTKDDEVLIIVIRRED